MDSILSRVEITTTNYIFLYLQLTWNKNRPGTNIPFFKLSSYIITYFPFCLFFLSFQIWLTSKENASLFIPYTKFTLFTYIETCMEKLVFAKKEATEWGERFHGLFSIKGSIFSQHILYPVLRLRRNGGIISGSLLPPRMCLF